MRFKGAIEMLSHTETTLGPTFPSSSKGQMEISFKGALRISESIFIHWGSFGLSSMVVSG